MQPINTGKQKAKTKTMQAFGVAPNMQEGSQTSAILDELMGQTPSNDEKAVKALKPKKGNK